MHKSGTTLVSRILHHSGIEMVEDAIDPDYDQGNQYERNSTKLLNKRLLGDQNQNSSKLRDPVDIRKINDSLRAEANRLLGELDNRNCDWGFKDPRTCLTYEFLAPLLPEHMVIAVFRDPRAVHRHYLNRNRGKWGIGLDALKAWAVHNRLIADIVRTQYRPTLLVNYDLLMQDDEELQRIEQFINSKATDQRITRLKRSENLPGLRFNIDHAVTRSLHQTDVLKLLDELCELHEDQVARGVKTAGSDEEAKDRS